MRRRRFPVGASPTRQTLQPEAIGAVMEVTKWLKPSISVSRIGDSASVQAVTRVNAEQALYGAFEVKQIFCTFSTSPSFQFLCSTWNPVSSPRPTHALRPTRTGPVKVGRRSAPGRTLRRFQARALTGTSTAAHAGCGRDDDQRGALPSGAGSSRHNLVFGRSVAT